MRRAVFCSVLAICLLPLAGTIEAAVGGAPPVQGRLPLLITNAGQGPGGKMARLLARQSQAVQEATLFYQSEPKEADLRAQPFKTLMIVIGTTAKGLGASGITIDQEIARLEKMIVEARRLKMQIVAVLLEGKTRRGKPGGADERCIDAIAPFADYLVVKKDGNEDGRFDAIAGRTKAPLTLIDDALDFTDVVRQMYGRAAPKTK
jgi:hypothetical protein